MSKLFFVLFVLFVCGFSVVKGEKSENKTDIAKSMTTDDDDDESASIQFDKSDTVPNKVTNSSIKLDENPQAEENNTQILINANSTHAKDKYDTFFKDIISDSAEILLETQDDNNEEVSMSTESSNETSTEQLDSVRGQSTLKLDSVRDESTEKVDSVLSESTEKFDSVLDESTEKLDTVEESTKPDDHDVKSQEDSTNDNKDENIWRSGEHSRSGENKSAKESASEEDERNFSVESPMNKSDFEIKERTDARHSEISNNFDARRINSGHYQPSDEHGSGVVRSFGETMVPRYRPVLTRSGIVYTQALYPMQRPSLIDRLSRNNWGHMNPEIQTFRPLQNRFSGVTQYEESKLSEDYSDNDPNTNNYAYTPVKKMTTVAPVQQIAAPNKFDVFQKLVEASNHPKSKLRTFDELPSNYQPRRFF